jgi:hypothetical protein
MFVRSLGLIIALALATAAPAGAQQQAGAKKNRIEGTWQVTSTATSLQVCDANGCTPVDAPPPFKVLISFSAGRSANEGTLVDTSEFELTPNPVCTPDQGTWERQSDGSILATHLNFCFDATNGYAPAGPTKVRDRLTLTDADHFTGRQYVEGFDTNGVRVVILEATLDGTRVHAEAPPDGQ